MEVITYFTEEKIQNLFCMILGSLSVILALLFLSIIKYSFYKGMAIPLLLFGVLQATLGTVAFKRSTNDLERVQVMMEQQPERIETEELYRMQTVLQHFQVYQWIEIVLIAAGLVLYLKFYKSPSTFWKGLGLGLVLQASVTLGLDTIGHRRAERYVHQLMPTFASALYISKRPCDHDKS